MAASGPLVTTDLVGLFRQSLAGTLLDCNDSCARILGYSSREELLRRGFEYVNASDLAAVAAALPDVGELSNVELALRKKDGGVAWILQNLRVTADEIEGAMFDVTEQRLGVQKLEYQAQHDSLTHLPNRTLIADRINVALARTKRHGGTVAVLLLDLDHFEGVSSAFGQGIADRVLMAVADRLADCIRVEDALGRFGSDEFIVVLADCDSEAGVGVVAQRMLDAIGSPLEIGGHAVRVTASIGIALSPSDGDDCDALMQRAMTAARGAKDRGRNRYHFHQSELNARALERTALIAGLRRALERGELQLHYQPEVNVQTGRIECIEALLRWQHPEIGLMTAAEFFPAAEQGRIDAAITEWVFFEAARQAKDWHDEGMRNVRIAINVSSAQFYDRGLAARVKQALHLSALDAGAFELEITEPALASTARAAAVMSELHDLGVQLAIDDFGSGGCSFADLKRLPVDTLKIAPSFVHNVTHRSDDAAIVQSMITMARGLDMRVVAEGVESKEQLSHLLQRRCTDMQGYFFGRPRPAAELADVLLMQQH
jgi:diguanylate cyclase (GGDEF)-like protein